MISDWDRNKNLELLTDKLLKQNGLAHTLGFSSGRAGLLILYCELFLIHQDDRLLAIIDNNISFILEEIGSRGSLSTYYPANFSIGLCGISSLMQYLGEKDFIDEGDLSVILDQFSSTIYAACIKETHQTDLSYFHGISGVLNYLHASAETEKQNLLVAQILNYLKDRPFSDFFRNQQNQISLGVPHGLTGCLNILHEISRKSANNPELTKKLNQEISTLKKSFKCLPYFRKTINDKNSLTWSHGLPMLINLFLRFNADNHDEEIENLILEIYGNTYFEKHFLSGNCDLSISTGLCGLMLTVSSANKITSIPKLIQVEDQLKEIFLQNCNVNKLDFSPDKSSFFNGSTGIALGYCSLLTDGNSDWKQFLLLN